MSDTDGPIRILGIESSCDETSAAVVEDGRHILSNLVSSQDETHRPYGGVVPELASRQHLSKVGPLVAAALEKAGLSLADIGSVAVTQGPGLVGSLLVGLSFGKSIAYACGIPLLSVDHLEGHIRSVYLEAHRPISHPAISLVVSGGHTSLFLMEEEANYRLLGKTRDDAAGEAYDKVAKHLGLGYPGGPILDKLAALGDAQRFPLPIAKISDGSEDFSFSGLKTAVLRETKRHEIVALRPDEKAENRRDIVDLAASFQRTVVETLWRRTDRAARRTGAKTILVSGGVAANRELRQRFAHLAQEIGIPVLFPSLSLSTDNAAMIAAAGYLKFLRKDYAGLDLTADVELRLGEQGVRRASRHL